MTEKAGNRGAAVTLLNEILSDIVGVQLRTEQSKSGTVEEDAIQAFAISLIEVDVGAIPLANIDITGIVAVMEKSTGGAAFSDAGITQPTFTKANGLVSVDYRFLAAQWIIGDVYKLSVSGIDTLVNGDTVYVKAMIWSNVVLEAANVETQIIAIQADIDDATHGLAAIQVQVDDIQDKVDGTDATPIAYRREYGVAQIHEFSVTAAANAGWTNIATLTGQPLLIESIVLHADTGAPAHLTSAAIHSGTAFVVEFISAAVAIQADLDAEDKQVAWTGAVRLVNGEALNMNLVGTGADAVDFTVIVKYRSCVDGGYLA